MTRNYLISHLTVKGAERKFYLYCFVTRQNVIIFVSIELVFDAYNLPVHTHTKVCLVIMVCFTINGFTYTEPKNRRTLQTSKWWRPGLNAVKERASSTQSR